MEALTKTFRELIRSGWPNQIAVGTATVPCVFDRPIAGWWHGDREVISMNDLPALAIDAEALNISWSAFRTQEKEYKFDILIYVRRDNQDDSTTELYEIARLAERTIRKLSRWWIFDLCFFDLNPFIDPQYLVDNYSASQLTPYITTIESEFETDWDDTHTGYDGGSGPVAPDLREKDLAVAAYLKLYDEDSLTDPWATTTFAHPVTGADVTPKEIIEQYREDERVPARFVGDCRIESISYGYVNKGASLLRACQISVYAKEMDPVNAFGPL